MQWGRTSRHDSVSPVIARSLDRLEAELVIDPFADAEKASSRGNLLVHYAVPLVDRDDVFVVLKGGVYTGNATRETQTWSVRGMRWDRAQLIERWRFASDWKPVPFGSGGPSWEPVFHPILTADALWVPAAGGTIIKVDRQSGAPIRRFNPFGGSVNEAVFLTGPPASDAAGNVYYNAMQLNPADPWLTDIAGAWLVRIGVDGSLRSVSMTTLTPGAPAADGLCTTQFSAGELPWPPSRNAIAPSSICGSQRAGVNVAPAIDADGTIYLATRAHLNDRWGLVVAVNSDLTPKWTASLRNRFFDGCNVALPPNGTRGGCREGAITGISPLDNQPGSGQVRDDSTASPVVAPDGSILYGAYTRYNYSQGHLTKFSPSGEFLGSYGFGWDITPAVYPRGNSYSIVIKENQYGAGSYCGDPEYCPGNFVAPYSRERYLITQLDSSLAVEWQYLNTTTQSCARQDDGSLFCVEDHPNGFEWCVNAIAIDGRGVVYANSEDGYLYAISDGRVVQRLFLRTALGASYTPLSIGSDGRIYTQNDGRLFVAGAFPKRRAVRR